MQVKILIREFRPQTDEYLLFASPVFGKRTLVQEINLLTNPLVHYILSMRYVIVRYTH